MEGVGSEAASLAAHLGLDNLCWIYDNNHITIEGNTRIAFTEDVAVRFLAYRWNVLRVGDANDLVRIEDALATGQEAIRLDPNNAEHLVNLSLALVDADERDGAIACLLRALGLKHDHADGHPLTGR